VFNVKTGEWIQILQFAKTKPLDRAGTLRLSNESQDTCRLIHLKPIGEGMIFIFISYIFLKSKN
jgi:hypothetical protein